MRNGGRPRFRVVLGAIAVAIGLAAGIGCGGPQRRPVQTVELVKAPVPEGVWHTVARGQTLWRIAKTYGVPLETLTRVNEIAAPDSIDAGARIWIPGAAAVLEVTLHTIATTGFLWPVDDGRLLSGFGVPRKRHRHGGIDIGAQRGKPVRAASAGRVVYSGSSMRGYGMTIIIDHGDALKSLYAHNSALLARKGEWVERGQTIARVGRSGNATTDHCHFEIRRQDVPIDPLLYINGTPQ